MGGCAINQGNKQSLRLNDVQIYSFVKKSQGKLKKCMSGYFQHTTISVVNDSAAGGSNIYEPVDNISDR